MDRIKELSAFQGVILSADNYYSFSKLTSKGGNEEKIKYVLEKLRKFLQEKKYITENGVVEENIEDYRKLALYLILNSDLPILEEMTDMEGLDSVIWTLPTVPTFLLCELLWGLRMERFLAEAVAFCAPRLALQLGVAAADHLRRLDPGAELPRARLVAAALYRALLRLRRPPGPAAAAAPSDAAARAFRTCLGHFVRSPGAERLARDDRYRHLGRTLALALGLAQECLGRFNGRRELEAEGFADAYRATHLPDEIETESLDFNICDGPNAAPPQLLNECNAFLLDVCAALVMDVSVDAFCAWSEYEEDGRSVQRSIGELCFEVRRTLAATAGAAEHALSGMLRQLAREPAPRGAGALAAAAPELLARAAGAGPEPRAWRAAALGRADLCRQPDLLRLLEAHLAEFDGEQSFRLFEKITERLNEDREDGEYLKSLAVKAFRRCDADVKRAVVREQFEDRFHDDMESADFDDTSTEILNRLTAASSGGEPADALTMLLQNPRRAFTKIFKSAAENARQADVMLEVMICLKEFCGRRYGREPEPCVVGVSHHAFQNFLDSERKEESFVRFLCGLKAAEVIPGNELLLRVAAPAAHRALLARDVGGIRAQARLLAAAWGAAGLRPLRAPALALLAQLADALRWPPAAFRADLPPALDRVLALLQDLLDTYDGDVPEREAAWLRARLPRLHPLTRLHVGRALGAAPPPAAALLRALGSLTAREWRGPLRAAWRARGGAAAAPARGLRRLARALPRAGVPAPALEHALANYVAHLHSEYFDDPPTEEQALTALRAVARVARAAGPEAEAALAPALAPLAAAARRSPAAPAALAAALAAAPRLAAALAPLLRDR